MVAVLNRTGQPTRAEFHAAISARADRWYAACLRITQEPGLAEDAVQDALLSAWQKRGQFNRSASLETWIHRIAVNAALQIIRKRRPETFDPLTTEFESDTATPDAAREDYELARDLDTAMRRLSSIERVCFVLRHLEQWRLKEIAEELDADVGTVKQAVFRGVRKLRVRMARADGDPI